MILQVVVELVPWIIKKLVGILRPQSTEVLRMRLAVSMNDYHWPKDTDNIKTVVLHGITTIH